MLGVGPGSPDVMIGYMPAWRGVPAAVADALKAAKDASDQPLAAADKAHPAASGTAAHAAPTPPAGTPPNPGWPAPRQTPAPSLLPGFFWLNHAVYPSPAVRRSGKAPCRSLSHCSTTI